MSWLTTQPSLSEMRTSLSNPILIMITIPYLVVSVLFVHALIDGHDSVQQHAFGKTGWFMFFASLGFGAIFKFTALFFDYGSLYVPCVVLLLLLFYGSLILVNYESYKPTDDDEDRDKKSRIGFLAFLTALFSIPSLLFAESQ